MAFIARTLRILRALFKGPGWLDTRSGRWLAFPPMAGADDGGDAGGDKGGGDDDGASKGKGGDGDAGDKGGDGSGDAGGDDDDDNDGEPDWKKESRKHERRAKSAAAKAEELERKLKEREDADKSDQDKALEKAREEAKAEAQKEASAERRQDRLEVAVTRLSTQGFKIKDGDKEITVKFADPDDALVYVERAIARGDVEEGEIFDDGGKVKADALTTALEEILESKPHLKADANGGGSTGRVRGSSDAGKGSGGGKNLDDMSVEDHLGAITRHKS